MVAGWIIAANEAQGRGELARSFAVWKRDDSRAHSSLSLGGFAGELSHFKGGQAKYAKNRRHLHNPGEI